MNETFVIICAGENGGLMQGGSRKVRMNRSRVIQEVGPTGLGASKREESWIMAWLSGLNHGVDELEHVRRGADLGWGGGDT